MFKYFFYRVGLFLLCHLPNHMSYKLASLVSDMQYFLSFRDRRAVTNNLRKILPDQKDVRVETREVFRNFGRYLVEFFQMREMVNESFIKNRVHISGIHYLEDVQKKGRGGIIVTAHIGNWELGAVLVSTLGFPLMAVALPHRERPVNDLFNKQRETHGMTIVPPHAAFRKCLEHLKSNKFVALVADRDFSANGYSLDFLGHKTLIPKGAALFSLKARAPIIPVFLIRNEDGTFNLSCDQPIYPPDGCESVEEESAAKALMHQYIACIEKKIKAYPDQWLLFREFQMS